MNNIPNVNVEKKINEMYDKAKYLDKYGGSYYGTIFLLIIFVLVIGYLLVQINLEPIKKDFPKNKCNPAYIPFAGFIAKPPDQTAMEFTASNFSMCINQVLTMIVHNYTKPVNTVVNMITAAFKALMQAIAIIKKNVYRIKNILNEVMNLIMSRIIAAILPFLKIIIKLKDLFGKMGAMMNAMLSMLIGLYLGAKAWIGSLIAQAIILLIVIAAILIVVFIIPIFGPPIAAIGLIAWVIMATALALIVGYITYILSLTKQSVPSKPTFPPPPQIWPFCFEPDTLVNMNDNSTKKMRDIEIGDVLEGDVKVISVVQVKGQPGNPFYKIASKELDTYILVTGTHKIYDEEQDKFIPVEDFKHAKKTIFWAPKMYCLITENHQIPIGEYTFWDWED
tara:strand:- start:8608 stop:9786 length:1179 start_codon:yes stop_codon:yes gene_type:complete